VTGAFDVIVEIRVARMMASLASSC